MALKDLLRISDLAPVDVATLLRLSRVLRDDPYRYVHLLAHETVGCYFAKPSTRTRLSFATAISRLGAGAQMLGPADLQLGRGETIEDTARVMSSYLSAFVIRTFADTDVARFASAASIPVVNSLTDGHHPCQALADVLTIDDHLGHTTGVRHAYVGDGCNTAHSLAEIGALAGMHVTLACPPGYEPDPAVIEHAVELAATSGGSVRLTSDPFEAVAGADVVSTDTWVSMGIGEAETAARHRALQPYRVDERLMSVASPAAMFLHCLPAHRGEEVTAEVMDGPRSRVWAQAANRLCTAQAVLVALVERLLVGTV